VAVEDEETPRAAAKAQRFMRVDPNDVVNKLGAKSLIDNSWDSLRAKGIYI